MSATIEKAECAGFNKQLAGKYLTFVLEGESHAIPVLKVREIIRLAAIRAIPGLPGHVRGVINLRGKIIPVLDLRLRFGLAAAANTEQACTVVVQVRTPKGQATQMGLIVDAVEEVAQIAAGDIEATPDFGSQVSTDCLLGMAKIKGVVKALLDIDRVIGGDAAIATLPATAPWGALRFQDSEWLLHTSREIAERLATNQAGPRVRVGLLPDALLARGRTNTLSVRRYDFAEVCLDGEGRIWLGTEGGEVLRYDPADAGNSPSEIPGKSTGPWTLYNELDGIVCGRSPGILPLQDGTVWVVYSAGSRHLNRFDGTRWQARRLADFGIAEDYANPLQTRDGVVWLSERSGSRAATSERRRRRGSTGGSGRGSSTTSCPGA